MGPAITTESVAGMLGADASLVAHEDAVSLQPNEDTSLDGVLEDVLWSSAPQVRERLEISGADLLPLVTSFENGETLLGKTGNWYTFTPFLNGYNPQIQEWPYYNYLIYNLVTRAAGRQPVAFGDYHAAPIPQPRQRVILYITMAILVVVTWSTFFFVRRYSKAHPEALDSLVSGREAFMKHQANTDWEQIGFHRSIGGFIFALTSGLVLFIPLVAYQNFILPVYILPSAFSVLQTLTATVLPAISESVTNGKKILGQYYVTMTYKFGGFVSGLIAAILLSVADRFIIGSSGQDFQRAAIYVVPLFLIGAFNFASYAGDVVIYAVKSRLIIIFAILDFVIGFSLTYLLIDRWQVNALIYVPAITLGIKAFVVYWVNNRYCFPQRFYFWQTLGASGLAAVTHFLWLRWFTGLIWQQDEVTSIVILAFGLLLSFPVYSFLYGFFGGWDDKTLAEFDRGTKLSSFMKPMTRLFYHSSRLGARVSPLHGRFPISNFDQARREAEALTEERVKLLELDSSAEV